MDVNRQTKSVVAMLRVRGEGLETVTTRLNLERLFGASDFSPIGLPPKSVLCIKKISDPKPLTLSFDHQDLRFAEFWRKAVSEQVENFYRRAFRPIRESVPAQAESVVFADRAELLACLAGDWCRGTLAENWWWRGLFPNLFRAQTVAKIWLDSAEFIPAAFQILSKTGTSIRFVQKLQPHETKDLLRQIIKIFGLRKLEESLFAAPRKKAEFEGEKLAKPDKKEALLSGSDLRVFKKSEAVFSDLIPEIRTLGLSFEGQCLLGISLLLARSPKIVRSAEFARKLKLFRLKNETGKPIPDKIFEGVFEQNAIFVKKVKKSQKTTRKARGTSEVPIDQPKSAKTETSFVAKRGNQKAEEPFEKPQTEDKESFNFAKKQANEAEKFKEIREKPAKIRFETAQPEKSFEKFEQKKKGEKAKKSDKSSEIIKPPGVETAFQNFFEDLETEIEFSIHTRFGGVFYLLNLGLYLQLYRDFTESLETEIELNIWDFIALLSLEFLGGQIKTDAVWDFLKTMAERENDDEFGLEFDQFQAWRMPPEWLETFPKDQKWLVGKKGKRLVVRHSAGFNVVDVLLRGDAQTAVKNELEIYQKYFSETAKAERKDFSQMKSKSWLKNLFEYLEKRLFQALNLQTSEDLNALLFKRSAMISVSETHLDITFGLADLPIEVRLAGIDRDPGWIPAAGKFVYFHFA
ncbi:MAG TPA: hypothetical protein VNB22_18710 [Pyrinomonadaceae bacterium]|nr:hypothetical protein [Pyrinomonadaceae bacterium]